MKAVSTPASTKARTAESSVTFSAEERSAMKERAAEDRRAKAGVDGESEVLAKITAMKEPDRAMAKRIHAIVKESAPHLAPKTWYGMPAYANADGKAVLFFQDANKFKTRYATLGFSQSAKLDNGNLWPNAYALTKLTAADETTIAALIKKAAS